MRRIASFALVSLFSATGLFASGLPVPNSNLWDLTYGSNDTFTGFAPASAVVNPINPSVTLYGTAAPGGAQRVLEFLPFTSADVCYSTSCPSSTPLYPQPNFAFTIGGFVFNPFHIIAGTGISSATTDFSFFGDLTYLGSSAPFPSANGQPTLYTGEDSGGTTSYVYFVNADGTTSNILHVTDGQSGGAFLEGVLLDPPATLTLDILGFSNPGPNSFVTPFTPEPASLGLLAAGFVVLRVFARRSRSRFLLGGAGLVYNVHNGHQPPCGPFIPLILACSRAGDPLRSSLPYHPLSSPPDSSNFCLAVARYPCP